jgi:hypothetical protein
MYKIDYKIVRTDGRERLDNELIALLKDNYAIVRATTCSMGVEYILMKKTIDSEQASKELDKALGDFMKLFGGSEENGNPTTEETIIRDIEGDN